MTAAVLLALSALAFHAKPAAAYCSYYYGCRRVTGGAIAGIAIACVFFVIFLLACCMMGMRRRRAYYSNGGQGTWYPVSRGGLFPAAPPRDAEGGYGGQQAGWNNNGPPANDGNARGWLSDLNNNYYAPSGAPSGSVGHWLSEGPNAVPPPYDANAPKYAPPPGEPPAAHVRS